MTQILSGRAALAPEDFVALTINVMAITAALVMALLPETVAGKLLDGRGRNVMSVAWSASEVRTALISAIGIWMLFDGAVSASYWTSYLVAYHNQVGRLHISFPVTPDAAGGVAATIVQLALGLLVLTNALRIAEWVRRLGAETTQNK